ncbi:hypothetical protein M422DRAFT_240690 [Sphaerobolus stellatus SS14]|nr:hypothetical protein M422DRAFT_240690 [Sphaerobolus stellatus SS14]
MDDERSAQMQVDPFTSAMSAIQAFYSDPSTEWVIKSAPEFIAIKHKMGCSICDTSALHCMAAKQAYEICLAEKNISKAIADTWPELGRYQDDYYSEKKAEEHRAKLTKLYKKLDSHQATIKNLGNQVQSLEKQLQETKDNSDELSNHEGLILENKHLQKELEYYVGRVQYTLYGKDTNWVIHNGYHLSDIPASDREDNEEDLASLPTIHDAIPQDTPSHPPTKLVHPASKTNQNDSKVVHEAGISAIGGSSPPH